MAAEVLKARQRASALPKESVKSSRTRQTIIVAFWAVVVLLGLPHWTWTTSIPRSSLPLDSMDAWDKGNVRRLGSRSR